MDALWADLLPKLWPAFWTTIKLTVYSAIGSLVLGTLLTAMRVSPVGILRSLSAFYINTVRNTPLTLVILFCSFGLYQNKQWMHSGQIFCPNFGQLSGPRSS